MVCPGARGRHRRVWRYPKHVVAMVALATGVWDRSEGQSRLRPPRAKKKTEQAPATPQPRPVVVSPRTEAYAAGELPIPDSIVIPAVDFANQPIQDVLRLLSAPYGINMAVAPSLKARVTLQLTEIKLRDIVDFIIRENGYAFRVRNRIIQVYEPEPQPPPPSPPPPEPVQVLEVVEGKMTVDLKEAQLDSVIRWVARETGTNLIPEKGMTAVLSAFFADMPLDKGLSVLMSSNGLQLVTREGVSYVIPAGGGFDGDARKEDARARHFVAVREGRVSFDLSGASAATIIKEVARQAGLDIYMYGEPQGSVTAKVSAMPVDELFESVLRNTNFTFWLSGGVYFFGDKSLYEKKVVELIPVNYMEVPEAIALLPRSVTATAVVKHVKEYNAILVEAPTTDVIERAREFIAKLDKPIAQILIEAWVVEVKLDKIRKLGVELFEKGPAYQSPPRTYFPTFSGDYNKSEIARILESVTSVGPGLKKIIPDNFAAHLDILETEGLTNLISKPQIATLNGHSATISFGTTQYYLLEKEVMVTGENNKLYPVKDQRYEKININMTLAVKPWVSGKNEVTMEITPSFDVPGTQLDPKANVPPPVNSRTLKSTVRVKDGEMIVLGGLISESETNSFKKVPFLGDIPLLKYVFSSQSREKQKTQLMIYLIPRVYYGSEQTVDPDRIEASRKWWGAFGTMRDPKPRVEKARPKRERKGLFRRIRERRERRKARRAQEAEREGKVDAGEGVGEIDRPDLAPEDANVGAEGGVETLEDSNAARGHGAGQ